MSDIQPEYNWRSPVDTYRWLKAQMDKEGYKGSVLGYQPKGYHKVFTGQSADPNVTYWQPYEVSRTNALAPMAVYRHDTDKQTYWEDPANIGQWRDYLMLQEDDFVAPPYIDYDFIENSYQLMKQQNGGSDDWTSWKPLPFGHNLSYVAQQLPSPDTVLDPNFMTYAENKYVPGTNVLNPAYSVQVFNDYVNIVGELEAIETGNKTEFSKELQGYMTWLNQNATQQAIGAADLTEAEQANPIISDYQKEMEEVANADYNLMEPWEQAMLPFFSTADMKNRPSWSTNAGILSRGLLESIGGMGTGALIGGLIGTAIAPGPGTVAGAKIGSLIFGALSGITSIDASISERKGEVVNPATRVINRIANGLAEIAERTIGTDEILGENWISGSDDPQMGVEQLPYSQQIVNEIKYGPNKSYGGPEATEAANTNITWDGFWTAWKAAQLQYESVAGTENGGIGDWLIDSVSWIANKVDPEKNSGLQTGLGEVWQLHKGLSGPRALKGSGTIGRDSQIELYNLLADKDNPLEPETVLAIYRDKYGFSGNINDMVYQTLLDPAVLMPRIMAKVGLDITSKKVQSLKDTISVEGMTPELRTKLNNSIRWQNVMSNALGNPIVDMSPYPVQMLFDLNHNVRKGKGPRSTITFWQAAAEFRTLQQSGLLDVPTGSFTFKQGDVDLGTVSINKDNSYTWLKPDGTVEHLYNDVANAAGIKFTIENGQPVLYHNGERISKVFVPFENQQNLLKAGDEIDGGETVIDATFESADPNATQPPVAKATFEEQVVTVTPDVEMPDGTRATNVRVDPVAQTFEVHGQDGITYIARASDGIVIDTLNAEGVSIHDPNRTIKVNPVDIRVNGMTPKDVATAVDTVAIMGKPYVEPVQPDPRLAPRPVFPKDANLTTKAKWWWNEMRGLTRETQVRLSLRNFQDIVRNFTYLAGEGGSFTDVIKIVNGIFNGDIEKLSTAAQKLGNNIGVVTSKALFKEAINDPGVVAMVRLWQDPSNLQRVAAIKKLSGAIDVTPEVFVTMKPAELVSLIQKAVLKSGDKNALAMLGTITEASITSMIKPYSGKDPLPVTDKAMTKKWLNAVEVKIEENAVKVYNVTPNSNIQRMLNLDKQLLSIMVMWAGYLRTNLLSNIGTGVGTAGVPVYRSKKMIDGFWDTLGMAKPSEGDTAFRVKTHGALFEMLNGGDTIFKKALKKASVKLSDISRIQPFLKASGWLEGKAHEGADATFTMQQMRRLQLPEPPPSVKAALIRELGQDGYQNWLDARNQAMNPEMMDDVYKVTDNTEVKLAEIQKAVVDSLYKDHPELGTELINTLGIEDSLRNIIRTAKDPKDVDAMIGQLLREVKELPAIKAKIEAEAKLAEGAEKVRQEGILGLADVSMQIAESRLHTMLQSNAYAQTYWRKAMEAGPTGYHGAIRAGLENVKQLWDRANTNNLNLLKGALSAMDAADPRQQGLFVAANNWFTVGTEWADWRNNYWDTFHNAVHTEAEFVAAQEVVNLKSQEFRAREVEAIKAYAEEISNVLTNSQGKTVAGTDINQTGASAVALMEFFINGDKNVKGYLTIAKETEDFYSSTVGMPYKKRKELENKHFKKVAINLDKLQGEITKRAYNIWHRNNPDVAPATPSQPKPRAKHSDLDAKIANNNVQVKAAKAEIDAQTISKGNVTRSALRDFLSMTDTDPDIAMALVDSVADAWAFNNGKRPEEWYQNIGELAFVDADTFSANVFDKVIEAAGMTTFDAAGKAVLTFAKTGNLTTLTHELGHVIESTLNPDQLGLVVETFGDGLTVGEYGDLSNRFKANMPLSPEELAKHNKVAEGFAEGYQKWLMDDAVRMDTPSKLAQIFKTISDWLHKLIGRLSERISSMDFPDALKDLYERVTRVVDTANVEKTNSSVIANAPTGVSHNLIDANNVTYPVTPKVMDLRNIINSHNTDGTVNTIFPPEFQPRTYNQLFVVDTAKKLNPIKLLEKNSGFATGPIIVNSSGVVLVGNHRSGAMRLAQMDYPDVWKAYEAELVTRLADYGLSEKDIEGIEQPVIVYTVSDADARDVVKAGNIGEQQDYTAFDNAKRWSASFDIDTLTNMVIGEKQSFDDAIKSDANKYIRGDFFNGLSAPEKTGFIDSKTGYLNDQGVSAIKRSLAYLAFGGNETGDAFLKTAFDNADGMSMNVLNAMLASVPYVVKLNAEIAKGNLPANYSISEMLVNGVKEYNSFMSLPPDARHLDQMNMFDQPVSGKLDRDMIKFFINYNQSPSVISGIIEKYVSSAIASIVPPEAVSMFDAPAVEPTQLFKDIIKKFTGQEVGALQAITDNKSKALVDTMSANSAASWDAVVKDPITKALRGMLAQITPTPSTMPDWINVAGLMSEDVKKAYRTARATIKSILDEIEKPDTFKPSETRTIILQQAFTSAITVDQPLRNYVGLSGNKDVINWQANKLFQDIEQLKAYQNVWDSKGLGTVPAQQGEEWYGRVRTMKPSEFLSLVPPMEAKGDRTEYLMGAIKTGEKLAPPFLQVTWMPSVAGSEAFWRTTWHEGRHRALAYYKTYGDKPMPVFLMFNDGMRAPEVSDDMLGKWIQPQSENNAWDALGGGSRTNEAIPLMDEQAAVEQMAAGKDHKPTMFNGIFSGLLRSRDSFVKAVPTKERHSPNPDYEYVYWSPARPLSLVRDLGVEYLVNESGSVIFTKEPLPLDTIYKYELSPQYGESKAQTTLDFYERYYGLDSGLVFIAMDDEERGMFIEPSTRSVGQYQLTYFDSDGPSSDQTFTTIIDAVKEVVAHGGMKPVDPNMLDAYSESWAEGQKKWKESFNALLEPDDPAKATEIVQQAKELLAQGASEETIDKILDAANEVIPLMDEQAAFEQVGGDPKREVGIEKALMVIDQPVRGTPMGKTTPPIRPDGEMMTELELEINTLLEAFGDEVKPRIGKDFEYPEGAREALNKQLPIDKESLKEKVMAAAQTGQALRHEMLVDYATRYGVDQLAEVVYPYQLWYTRSALLWLKKLATTPGLAALVARYEEMLERNSLSGFPSRFGGKHMIPYGDNGALFFDWLGLVYPPKQIFGVIDNLADLSNTLYDETVSIITAQVRDGTLSAEAAKEAIAGRENETWNAAAAQAAAAWNEENNNAITMTSLAMLPRASLTNAYYYLINQEEKINPLTMTKLGNMLADVDPDGLIGVLGKIISLPENTVRKLGGLNRDVQYGEVYVDKKLSELAMSGAYSTDEVIRAMLDRSGPAYDEATRLAAADLIATSQPGGIVWHAIQTKNLDGLMPAIMTALFPKGLYSEEEMKQRGLQKEHNAAWNDYCQGDPKALDNFFEAHPEYEARLAVFKEPEERLKEYMIGGIWDAYGKLSSADKSLVTDQLGTNFEVLFLDNKTRNYDQLTIDTLVVWGKQLGAGVPASAEPTEQVTPLETYKPDVSAAAQQFVDYRTANFPNWYTLQKAYYEASDKMNKSDMINKIWDVYNNMSYNEQMAIATQLGAGFQTYFLDKETRDYKKIEPMVLANWGQKLGLELPVQAQMLQDFPELRNYLDWKEQYLAANPVVKQWLDEKADAYDGSDLTEYGNTTKEWFAQFDPVVGSALILYAYGEPLQPAAKSELIKVWEALGKPNYTFEKWLQYGIGR